jgi:branched-chain amino acid transport system ATP-binding protein
MLSVENIVTKYGQIEAVKGISFKVSEGELVSIIGANGAGKSTTMKTIVGLLKANSGHVVFNDTEITTLSAHQIIHRGICMVPEGRMIFPEFTIFENLQAGAYITKKTEFEELLEYVLNLFPLLKERIKQKAGTLSGGEQQMLAIGRALMANPKLLLLDEPSLGLAPVVVDKILELIVSINQKGVTVLLVEQDAYAALEISQRAYVMESGKLVLEGSAEELLHNSSVQNKYLGVS